MGSLDEKLNKKWKGIVVNFVHNWNFSFLLILAVFIIQYDKNSKTNFVLTQEIKSSLAFSVTDDKLEIFLKKKIIMKNSSTKKKIEKWTDCSWSCVPMQSNNLNFTWPLMWHVSDKQRAVFFLLHCAALQYICRLL